MMVDSVVVDDLAREFRKGLYWGVGITSVLFIILSVFFIVLLRLG